MPTIAYIGPIQIRIYYDDHGVPHFHAVSPDFDFKIAMADLTLSPVPAICAGATLSPFRRGDKSTAMRYIQTGNWLVKASR